MNEAATGNVPTSPNEVPQYIQFRLNGEDLGGPTITVVDFVGPNWEVSRGTGETANVLSVSLAAVPPAD